MVKAIQCIMFAASELHNGCTDKLRSPNPVSEKPGRGERYRVKKRTPCRSRASNYLINGKYIRYPERAVVLGGKVRFGPWPRRNE